MGRKLTREDKIRLAAAYLRHKRNATEAGREIGCHHSVVIRAADDLGVYKTKWEKASLKRPTAKSSMLFNPEPEDQILEPVPTHAPKPAVTSISDPTPTASDSQQRQIGLLFSRMDKMAERLDTLVKEGEGLAELIVKLDQRLAALEQGQVQMFDSPVEYNDSALYAGFGEPILATR